MASWSTLGWRDERRSTPWRTAACCYPWIDRAGPCGPGRRHRQALRALDPSVQISWLAGDPARQLIADAGETLLPESVGGDTASAEQIAGQFAVNVAQYARRARSAWAQNVARFKQVIDEYAFYLVVGDETYELMGAFAVVPSAARADATQPVMQRLFSCD